MCIFNPDTYFIKNQLTKKIDVLEVHILNRSQIPYPNIENDTLGAFWELSFLGSFRAL